MRRALRLVCSLAVASASVLAVGCSSGSFDVPASGVDSGVGDTAPSDSGAADVGDAAPTTGWCHDHSSTTTLCEDFDEVASIADLVARWSGATGGGGSLSLTNAAGAPSPPHALLASAGNSQKAYVAHAPWTLTTKPTSLRLEYDLRIDQQAVQALDGAPLAAIVLGTDPDTAASVYLYVGFNGALALGWVDSVAAGHALHVSALNVTPAIGVWAGRWAIVVDMVNGNLTVTHDGATVGKTTASLKSNDLAPTSVAIAAGLVNNTAKTGEVVAAFDNLVFDIK